MKKTFIEFCNEVDAETTGGALCFTADMGSYEESVYKEAAERYAAQVADKRTSTLIAMLHTEIKATPTDPRQAVINFCEKLLDKNKQ